MAISILKSFSRQRSSSFSSHHLLLEKRPSIIDLDCERGMPSRASSREFEFHDDELPPAPSDSPVHHLVILGFVSMLLLSVCFLRIHSRQHSSSASLRAVADDLNATAVHAVQVTVALFDHR